MKKDSTVSATTTAMSVVTVVQTPAQIPALYETLESLKQQTLPADRFEVIVVDAGAGLSGHSAGPQTPFPVRVVPHQAFDQSAIQAGVSQAKSALALQIDHRARLEPNELMTRYEGPISTAKHVPKAVVDLSRRPMAERVAGSGRSDRFDLSNVTFAIKTFLRPKSIDLLIRSIRLFYPEARIIVADDGRDPVVRSDVEKYLVMPFDQGLSAGRNLMLEHIETEFAMLLDDDTVFTEATRIEYAMDVFAASESIDLVAGRYLPDVFFGAQVIEDGVFVRDIRQCREVIDGFPIYDFLPNFFVARTEKLREILWDEELKLQEHMEFFWRARGKLNGTYLPYFSSINAHINESTDYLQFRHRSGHFQAMQARKLNVSSITSRVGPSNMHEFSVCDLALFPRWLIEAKSITPGLTGQIGPPPEEHRDNYPPNVISDQHKAIFIHVPKTAGISMKMALFQANKGAHAMMRDVAAQFPQIATDYFSFGFVRNPWDRLVSAFFFLSKGGTGNAQDKQLYADVFQRYEGDFARFVREFVRTENVLKILHLRPQWYFLCDANGGLLVDTVERFEALQDGFNTVCDHINIPRIELERTNASAHRDYRDYYDDETRSIVASVYQRDIELFAYTFD